MHEFKTLIAKDFRLELRRQAVLSGIVLYLLATVFIAYIAFAFAPLSTSAWAALFWITLLFTAINTAAKSFLGEERGLSSYYFTIAAPEPFICAKIVYNALLILMMSLTCFVLFMALLTNPIFYYHYFLLLLVLMSFGFSAAFTLLSAISSKARHSHVVMAVLSFPVVVGLLMVAIKLTKACMVGNDPTEVSGWITLLAINVLLIASSFLLFPYIWRTS